MEAVKAYMIRKGKTRLAVGNGYVDLRTSYRKQLDHTLVPADVLDQARSECTTIALWKHPNRVQVGEGEVVGRDMVGAPAITLAVR